MVSRAVLITGCSSGIGHATALRLADAGRPVYATARRPEALAKLVRRKFETNVFGPVRLAQLVLPGMRRQRWGRIVNVGTIGGKLSFPGGAFYHGSKHALEAIGDVLRFELRPFGIDVVVVEPGLIRSGFADGAVESMDGVGRSAAYAEYVASVAATTTFSYERGPLARLGGEPDAVARTSERALAARRSRSRYPVTSWAWLLLTLHGLVGDCGWDWFMRGGYAEPIPGETPVGTAPVGALS